MTDDADLRLDVTAFDRVSAPAALELMRPVCASPAWMDAMVARRPHRTLEQALETSDAVVRALSWPQVEQATAAEPGLAVDAPADGDRARHQLAVRAALAALVDQRLRTVLV